MVIASSHCGGRVKWQRAYATERYPLPITYLHTMDAADLQLLNSELVSKVGIDMGSCPELLGRGTFGCVYKATYLRRTLDGLPPVVRPLAVKFIHTATRDEDLRHLEVLQALSHHGIANRIIPILYVGYTECIPAVFMVTPFVATVAPIDVIRDSSLDSVRIYMCHLLEALSFCEAQGIVHRDVKPRNVLWDPVQQVGYLTDFGLVDLVSEIHGRAAKQDRVAVRAASGGKAAQAPLQSAPPVAAGAAPAPVRRGPVFSSKEGGVSFAPGAAAGSLTPEEFDGVPWPEELKQPAAKLGMEDFAAIAASGGKGTAELSTLLRDAAAAVAANPARVAGVGEEASERSGGHYFDGGADCDGGASSMKEQPSALSSALGGDSVSNGRASTAGRSVSSSIPTSSQSSARTTAPAAPTASSSSSSSSLGHGGLAGVLDGATVRTYAQAPGRLLPTDAELVLAAEETILQYVAANGRAAEDAALAAFRSLPPEGRTSHPLLHREADKAGTAGFRAPEVLLGHADQTTAIDVWAAGVILLTFLTGRYPLFPGRDDMEHLLMIMQLWGEPLVTDAAARLGRHILQFPNDKALFNPPRDVLERFRSVIPRERQAEASFADALHLCLCLLRPHPGDRLTASGALEMHPWLRRTVMSAAADYSGGGSSAADAGGGGGARLREEAAAAATVAKREGIARNLARAQAYVDRVAAAKATKAARVARRAALARQAAEGGVEGGPSSSSSPSSSAMDTTEVLQQGGGGTAAASAAVGAPSVPQEGGGDALEPTLGGGGELSHQLAAAALDEGVTGSIIAAGYDDAAMLEDGLGEGGSDEDRAEFGEGEGRSETPTELAEEDACTPPDANVESPRRHGNSADDNYGSRGDEEEEEGPNASERAGGGHRPAGGAGGAAAGGGLLGGGVEVDDDVNMREEEQPLYGPGGADEIVVLSHGQQPDSEVL